MGTQPDLISATHSEDSEDVLAARTARAPKHNAAMCSSMIDSCQEQVMFEVKISTETCLGMSAFTGEATVHSWCPAVLASGFARPYSESSKFWTLTCCSLPKMVQRNRARVVCRLNGDVRSVTLQRRSRGSGDMFGRSAPQSQLNIGPCIVDLSKHA